MDDHGKIVVTSHNIFGFENSKDFLYERCDGKDISILAVQEHWLHPPYRKHLGTDKFKILHPDYESFAVSGMQQNVSEQIMRGRPYGGTGFLYAKAISNAIKPRMDYISERVSVLQLKTTDYDVLLINVYFPYFDSSRLQEQLIAYRETLAFVETVLVNNPNSKVVLMADFNCNLYDNNHPFSRLIRDFMTEYGLFSCFDLIPSFDPTTQYTRCDIKRNSYTLIDYVLISQSLRPFVENVCIDHHPLNVSDHIPVRLELNVNISPLIAHNLKSGFYIPWNSLKDSDIDVFRNTMANCLDQIAIPTNSINHCTSHCDESSHILDLERYYSDVVDAVKQADLSLPRLRYGTNKSYWSPELNDAKTKSYDAFSIWKASGSPMSGPIYQEKVATHFQYKRLLRKHKSTASEAVSEQLADSLINRDSGSFWRHYKRVNSARVPPATIIAGSVDDKSIVKSFTDTYSSVYADSGANQALKNKFEPLFEQFSSARWHNSLSDFLFTWDDMLNAVVKLKVGKATSNFIKAQHVFHGSPKLMIHLHILFNSLLNHGYVPHEFLCGTISPIIKDRSGDTASPLNYRPITLGVLFAQLFEVLLLNKFERFLECDNLQFGFKSKHSTAHAIYVLKMCSDYFYKHGSSTYVTFLDCSKAFDKVSHYGLFIKLMQRNVPLPFLRILAYWYLNMKSRCSWNGVLGEFFDVTTGVKQGGVLSPRLFTVYVDDMIHKLRTRGIGCHVIDIFLACVMFADDLCLITPTRESMQQMLDICQEYCREFNLSFNAKKSKTMIIGNHRNTITPLSLNGTSIDIVTEWRYLGTTLVAGKELSFSARSELRSFYCSVNSLLSAQRKPNEVVLMNLLYSKCVPIVTYAAQVKSFKYADMHACQVALNDAIRRIFGYNRWESIRSLRTSFGYNDLYHIFHHQSEQFGKQCRKHKNEIICALSRLE